MRSLVNARSRDKWCRFHNNHGHNTEHYIQLKREIEKLLEQRHLKEYVRVNELRTERKKGKESKRKHPGRLWTPFRKGKREVVNVIFGKDSKGRDNLVEKRSLARHVFLEGTGRHPLH